MLEDFLKIVLEAFAQQRWTWVGSLEPIFDLFSAAEQGVDGILKIFDF
jgi:hypothetical protein